MRRITRYVLGELLIVFGLTLSAMTAFMILVGLAQEAIRQGLGPEPILRLVPYVLPNALRFAVPGTILFAACSVYGRMSATNEIVAVKSLGISPLAVLWPGYALAFFVSLVAVWLNDVAATWGREGMQRVVMQSLEEIVYGTLRVNRSYRNANGRFSISVRNVDGRKLIRPSVTFQSEGNDPPVTLTAREAELRGRPETESLAIVMWDVVIERGDARMVWPNQLEHEVSLRDASRSQFDGKHPTEYAFHEIPLEITAQQRTIQELEQTIAATAACQLMTGDFEQLSESQWQQNYFRLQSSRGRLFRLYAEPWRRWANGFSCFFFVWVGAPLAIRWRNSDLFTTFFACFGPVLLVYYPLMAYGVDRAKAGALPPYSVWLGNIILLAFGFWLLRRVLRY